MKKLLGILILTSLLLVGCGQSQTYGYMDMDWQAFNETHEDYHVYYASSDIGCFTDGSIKGNTMADYWLANEDY